MQKKTFKMGGVNVPKDTENEVITAKRKKIKIAALRNSSTMWFSGMGQPKPWEIKIIETTRIGVI